MKRLIRYCAVAAVFLLAACAETPQRRIEAGPAFELAGRIAVRQQDKGFSSALRWKQAAGRDELWLTTPLGQTLGYLESDANGATLTASDQRQYRASSIESLTRSAFGWRFPVDGVRYWIFGEAAPGTPPNAIQRDASRRVVSVKDGDWQIAFNYPNAEATRPSRLDISGNYAEIRVVIDKLTRDTP